MALEFINDAISLSGLTGSKLKSEIISEYYPFWWNITSGGDRVTIGRTFYIEFSLGNIIR